MNHSPAPWETSKDAVPAGHVQVTVYDTEGNRVATVFQNEGNVALVKAAPLLLAAIHAMVEASRIAYAACYCGPQQWTETTKEAYRILHCEAERNALDVIRKAEGQS